MTDDGRPAGPVPHARFEVRPADDGAPATVRAIGDIDLTNVGHFQAALDQAAAASIHADTAGPITESLLKVSGLDQVATVVTLDSATGSGGRPGRSS